MSELASVSFLASVFVDHCVIRDVCKLPCTFLYVHFSVSIFCGHTLNTKILQNILVVLNLLKTDIYLLSALVCYLHSVKISVICYYIYLHFDNVKPIDIKRWSWRFKNYNSIDSLNWRCNRTVIVLRYNEYVDLFSSLSTRITVPWIVTGIWWYWNLWLVLFSKYAYEPTELMIMIKLLI